MRYSQVRKLARQYADGVLPRDEYLARRRTLIGEIVAGKIPLRHSPLTGPDIPRIGAHFVYPAIIAVAILVVITGGAMALHFLHQPAKPAANAALPVRMAQQGPGVSLIKQFVESSDWSDDSIIEFETQMMQLTPRQRANLRDSIWFRRLGADLARQITEQRAMVPLDPSGKAERRARSLKAFAARLQIDPDA